MELTLVCQAINSKQNGIMQLRKPARETSAAECPSDTILELALDTHLKHCRPEKQPLLKHIYQFF